jgi:hypothetical protein
MCDGQGLEIYKRAPWLLVTRNPADIDQGCGKIPGFRDLPGSLPHAIDRRQLALASISIHCGNHLAGEHCRAKPRRDFRFRESQSLIPPQLRFIPRPAFSDLAVTCGRRSLIGAMRVTIQAPIAIASTIAVR